MQHLQPNTTLQGGKYRIERVLGQGGFGITYLARNTVFDVDVAIKEFFMKDENDREGSSVTMPNTTKQDLFDGQKEKFKKEAKRMFAIKNEHIIGVHDLFEENGTAYYVMDYVDGENLSDRLKRTGKPMTEDEVNQILPQILDALKSIHDAGIWHLDLKPANIMVDKSGNVKLIDFGASKQLNAQKGGATTSTAISYTNGYAPREQMEQNYDKFGPWTDIYALGATLYNLLTNKRPPLPTDIDDDMSEDKHETLPFPEDICEEMKSMVLMMLNTNRIQRPQSINDIIIAEKATNVPLKEISKQQINTIDNNRIDEDTIIATPQSEETDIKQIKPIQELLPKTNQYESEDSNDTSYLWIVIGIVVAAVLIGYFLIPKGCAEYSPESSTNEEYKSTLDLSDTLLVPGVNSVKHYTGKIYDVVEEMPSYPGGSYALFTFLSNNIKYPEEAEMKGIEGRVLVTFIVESNGIINDVKVASSVHKLLDKEAVRVIKTMPKWMPGKQNGEPVRVKYTVPVTFKLK